MKKKLTEKYVEKTFLFTSFIFSLILAFYGFEIEQYWMVFFAAIIILLYIFDAFINYFFTKLTEWEDD